MVAAAIVSRQGPASRSAARRNTAARSSNGVAAQSAFAAIAASTAAAASAVVALVRVPSFALWRCGWTTSMRSPSPIRCRPAITCGRSMGLADRSRRAADSRVRSAEWGAYSWIGSLAGAGTSVRASMTYRIA